MKKHLIVCLAWATKKRHIAINNKVLCQPNFTSGGYSVKNHQYNTIILSGLPDYEKIENDAKFSHPDGIIEFKPLNQQKTIINEQSICKQCLKKYNKLLSQI